MAVTFFAPLPLNKPQDLWLIQKFVRRKKRSKCKIVSGQSFEKATNLGPYLKHNPFPSMHKEVLPSKSIETLTFSGPSVLFYLIYLAFVAHTLTKQDKKDKQRIFTMQID